MAWLATRTFALALLVIVGSFPAHAADRIALVIGNDDYAEVEDLQKAVSDARAMAETLGDIGFDVIRAENVTRRDMNREIQRFAAKLDAGDEAVFFFAGHGVEIDGRNYLLPTDIPNAAPGQEAFVSAEALAVDRVLDRIRGRGTRVSILILDACRNNPFPKSATRSLGGTRGLARTVAPEGAFILYSAGVGQTALDRLGENDPHPNSVFTRSLIPLLRKPGLSLIETARQVRRDVQELAASVPHDQRPAYYDEVTGDFFFVRDQDETTAASTTPSTDAAGTAWQTIQDSDSPAVLEAFIAEFPDSSYAKFAAARIGELTGQGGGVPSQTAVAPKGRRLEWGAYPSAHPSLYEHEELIGPDPSALESFVFKSAGATYLYELEGTDGLLSLYTSTNEAGKKHQELAGIGGVYWIGLVGSEEQLKVISVKGELFPVDIGKEIAITFTRVPTSGEDSGAGAKGREVTELRVRVMERTKIGLCPGDGYTLRSVFEVTTYGDGDDVVDSITSEYKNSYCPSLGIMTSGFDVEQGTQIWEVSSVKLRQN